jgi:hypothetical protein
MYLVIVLQDLLPNNCYEHHRVDLHAGTPGGDAHAVFADEGEVQVLTD